MANIEINGIEVKNKINTTIRNFSSNTLTENGLELFKTLGYNTERSTHLDFCNYQTFSETYINGYGNFYETKAIVEEWKYIDLLFQLSKDEMSSDINMFDTSRVDNTIIESYLFICIELEKDYYTRTALSMITREINKLFPMPVLILFKYGNFLTLSVINRRINKREESKDVLEKVTLIKDINITNPHRAHIEILYDLSFNYLKDRHKFTNFVELHKAWEKVLNTKDLNNKFYSEIATWYYWAKTKVKYPDGAGENDEKRNSTSLIRLLTRLIFVWFLKEKHLVPEELFNKKFLDDLLNYGDKTGSTYYKAILQNLFFATLNTPMKRDNDQSRIFIDDAKKYNYISDGYLQSGYYRYKRFIKNPDELIKVFSNIPFLNGGLFECLDTKSDDKKEIRIDCFSDNPKNEELLKVPDELFFSDTIKIELKYILGSKGKNCQTKGIINILNNYKFTINENTPIEEEIALDPELLGKVFENLLASYNHEAQTNERNITGSFYTPREIVDYMVDESLIAYLTQKLSNHLTQTLSEGEDLSDVSPSPLEKGLGAEVAGNHLTQTLSKGEGFSVISPSPSEKGSGAEVAGNHLTQTLSEGEDLSDVSPSPLEKGLGAEVGYMTTTPEKWKYLIQFAKENRKNPTKAEAILWEELRNKKLGFKFRRQHPIDDFIVDFVCLEKKLVIEVDGDIHDVKEIAEYDIIRTDYLEKLGFTIVRVRNEKIINNLSEVLSYLTQKLSNHLTQTLSKGEDLSVDSPSPLEKGLGVEVAGNHLTQTLSEGEDLSVDSPSPLEKGLGVEVAGERAEVSGVETRLRHLLSYSNDTHLFDENETNILINAIDKLKILDPACGSGAFPMGILHKLVFILHKLDPDNNIWKQKLLDKSPVEIRDEYEKTLKNKSLDYTRKLGLIESCIYGVDIQPIAIQIAKLRFFISLIVEQNIDDTKENRDIKALPNLETKFVVANTLIGLQKDGGLITPAVEKAENELFEIRKNIFYSNSSQKKRKLQEKEEKAREELNNALRQGSFDNKTAQQVAKWNPYDQNYSSDWFDPEWMFGIKDNPNLKLDEKDGFDIVIGNPPYINLSKNKLLGKLYKDLNFKTFDSNGDIYLLFYEKGFNLLTEKGHLCYITSNKWMRAGYGEKIREYFVNKTNPILLIDFAGNKIFDNATVDVNILILQKDENKQNLYASVVKDNVLDKLNDYIAESKQKQIYQSSDSWVIFSNIERSIKQKIERIGTPLKDWDIKINRGIVTGCNEAFIIDGKIKNKLIAEDPKSAEIIKPILRGRDIKRYTYNFADIWLINTHNGIKEKGIKQIDINNYPAIKKHLDKYWTQLNKRQDKGDTPYNLRNCTFLEDFYNQKIVYGQFQDHAEYCYSPSGWFLSSNEYFIGGNYPTKYFLSILNSTISMYFLKSFLSNSLSDKSSINQKSKFVYLPIPKISLEDQQPFIDLVDKILAKKERNENTAQEEQAIDFLVYKLYELSYDEIKIIDPNTPITRENYERE